MTALSIKGYRMVSAGFPALEKGTALIGDAPSLAMTMQQHDRRALERMRHCDRPILYSTSALCSAPLRDVIEAARPHASIATPV
jgi:hypothetical protein